MQFSPVIEQLISSLRCLPGVGPKSSQRMAFHLLERDREGGEALAKALSQAICDVGHCQNCRTFCETALCPICSNVGRERSKICIVESPADIVAIEQTAIYRGLYFVLMGHLSPLDGIGPDELGIKQLLQRIDAIKAQELILATNPTVEGEATAHYIINAVKPYQLKVTRIAHGVPLGGELEFIDSGTLAHAIKGRETVV